MATVACWNSSWFTLVGYFDKEQKLRGIWETSQRTLSGSAASGLLPTKYVRGMTLPKEHSFIYPEKSETAYIEL